MERVRFLSIFGSNLDEFFEIRISGLKQQIESRGAQTGPDRLAAPQVFELAQKRAHELVAEAYRIWNESLVPALAAENIFLNKVAELPPAAQAWAERFFNDEIFPTLTPLAVDPSHPFPQLANKSHNLIVSLQRPNEEGPAYAIVQIPKLYPRLLEIPADAREGLPEGRHYIFLQGVIRQHLGRLYPGIEVRGAWAFRMTRNSDLYIDEEEADNLLEHIEDELRRRSKGNAVRLELADSLPEEIERFLLENFKLGPADAYRLPGPVNFLHLEPLYSSPDYPTLKDKPFTPARSGTLAGGVDIFEVLRRQDVLLHHPYEGFGSVVDFVERAAEDPRVLALKLTLYRTNAGSPIMRALIRAAAQHKQVTVLMELKARFDEENNIRWARELQEAGVHVVYGLVGYKTHCKMMLVVRRDEDRIRLYAHLGTGNYNAATARFYTDLGLLTANQDLNTEVATVFNNLTGLSRFEGGGKLILAPFEMRDRFCQLIARERDLGPKGRIIVKLNALVDDRIIGCLFEAAAAGVQIDLVVRGICCLRPGVPGVSENVRVRSIVGRFLEHSRIYWFGNDGQPLVYVGSADWMARNFDRRVEVVFPIEEPALRARITDEILPAFLSDNVKAHELPPTGATSASTAPRARSLTRPSAPSASLPARKANPGRSPPWPRRRRGTMTFERESRRARHSRIDGTSA